jgi:hypothetical protein
MSFEKTSFKEKLSVGAKEAREPVVETSRKCAQMHDVTWVT